MVGLTLIRAFHYLAQPLLPISHKPRALGRIEQTEEPNPGLRPYGTACAVLTETIR